MSRRSHHRVLAGVVLATALTLAVPMPGQAVGAHTSKAPPSLESLTRIWLGAVWGLLNGRFDLLRDDPVWDPTQDKQGLAVDPNGQSPATAPASAGGIGTKRGTIAN
ncbi:MAG: hypothetical protein M3O15_13900 [Acidobacteriota bacterium]|nr:hypothetical protein [Acidobacteriota bacterium]